MIYECKTCNYESTHRIQYERHLATKKHRELNRYICSSCSSTYAHASGLSKHKKICGKKEEIHKQKHEQDHEMVEEFIKQSKQHVNNKNDINNSEITNSFNTTHNSIHTTNNISIKTYIVNKFQNAPALEPLKDYSIIEKYEPLLLEYDDIEFIDVLIRYSNDKLLDKYLGDFLIKYYKKEKPEDQSLWNSDTSRLTYIIKQLLHNKTSDWIVDKKGIKISEYIISPLLNYIKKLINDYITKITDYNFFINHTQDECTDLFFKIQSANVLSRSIDDGIVANKIIKYIAPYFYLDIKTLAPKSTSHNN